MNQLLVYIDWYQFSILFYSGGIFYEKKTCQESVFQGLHLPVRP